MAKKELRLAVVIYGGASLAVYMHGVTKELLKVVRASKVLHELGAERAQQLDFADGPDTRPHDTEAVYFDALKEINRTGHFRVVIDVVAGASAGAVNGVMLAKSLVDDAQIDAQTEGWLRDADVEHLGAEDPSPWRKWYLYPFLRGLSYWLPRDVGTSPETREKIARLVRSSWFRPPFSGERLCHHFFDALDAMGRTRRAGSSLLPPDQRLDVYASITDLAGYPRTVRLHEELIARETEHAAFCQLTHVAGHGAGRESDFAAADEPGLVWAARASSSYAGAFPPFHHRELERVLEARGRVWAGAGHFLRNAVRARDGTPAHRHFDPAARYFVDGGIVNNKPFGAALAALNHRPSDRQVARYLVYVEPDPFIEPVADPSRDLGYLATIRAAVSSIPRNQPILDDLDAIMAQDTRAQINRRIIEANRGEIEQMVANLRAIHSRQAMTTELVTYLRLAMADQAELSMGLAYHGYVQRRVWRLVDALVQEWAELAGVAGDPALARGMEECVAEWWRDDGAADAPAARRDNRQEAFLEQFDVAVRIRRMQFLIRRINHHEDDRSLDEAARTALDAFKQEVYGFLERCYRLRRPDALDRATIGRLRDAVGRLPLPSADAVAVLKGVSAALALEALDRELDRAFFAFHQRLEDAPLRERILGDYLGFPVYDVLLLAPGSLEGGPDPLTPIRVDRISPEDARSLSGAFDRLRCRDFMGFVGFFNQDYREHDYLWGRLNGAERMVDLLARAAGPALGDPVALKRRLFQTIVDRERRRLRRADDLDRVAEAARKL
ncbi:MAG: patatin-like protein [Pseudomonadota bacterium]